MSLQIAWAPSGLFLRIREGRQTRSGSTGPQFWRLMPTRARRTGCGAYSGCGRTGTLRTPPTRGRPGSSRAMPLRMRQRKGRRRRTPNRAPRQRPSWISTCDDFDTWQRRSVPHWSNSLLLEATSPDFLPHRRGKKQRDGAATSGREMATDGAVKRAGVGAAAKRYQHRGAARPAQEIVTRRRPESMRGGATACAPYRAAPRSCYASAAGGAVCAEPTSWAASARSRTPAAAKHWPGWRRASTHGKRETRPLGRKLEGAHCVAKGPLTM